MGTTTDRRERVRAALSILLSFFLSLFLTLLALVLLVQTTFLSPSFFRRQIDRSGYVTNLVADLEDYFVSYGETSGFDASVFTTVLEEQTVRADVVREIDRLYAADGAGADIQAFRDRLYQQLTENVQARQIAVTSEIDGALRYLVQICAETYQDGVGLPLATYAASGIAALRKPLLFALIGVAVLTLFAAAFLFIIQPIRKRALRYYGYACGGAALMLAVPAAWLLLSGRIGRIGITGKALYHLVVTYARQAALGALLAAGILLLLTAGAVCLDIVLTRREGHGGRYAPRHAGGAEQPLPTE